MLEQVFLRCLDLYQENKRLTYSKDVVLLVGSSKSPVGVHKSVLAESSPIFKSMFYTAKMMEASSSKPDVEIPDIEVDTMSNLIKYCYLKSVSALSISATFDLLRAADKYGINDLKSRLTNRLIDSMNESNCAEILNRAAKLSFCEKIQERAFDRFLGTSVIEKDGALNLLAGEFVVRILKRLVGRINPDILIKRGLEYLKTDLSKVEDADKKVLETLKGIVCKFNVRCLTSPNIRALIDFGITNQTEVLEELYKHNDAQILKNALKDSIEGGLIFHIYGNNKSEICIDPPVPITVKSKRRGQKYSHQSPISEVVAANGVKVINRYESRYWRIQAANMRLMYVDYDNQLRNKFCPYHKTIHDYIVQVDITESAKDYIEGTSIIVDENHGIFSLSSAFHREVNCVLLRPALNAAPIPTMTCSPFSAPSIPTAEKNHLSDAIA